MDAQNITKIMQSINALSLSPNIDDWLANSHQLRILHVFDRACNLINERGEVLSIVTPQIGNGPFNIVVENNVLFSEHLNLQSVISNSAKQLDLGDLTIHTADAELWNPRPDWEELHANRDNILTQLANLQITTYQVCGLDMPSPALHQTQCGASVATTAQGYSTTIFNPKLPTLAPRVICLANHADVTNYQFSNSLISSLSIANISSSLTLTRKLAGLGTGLTPAGDDFIMGAIFAAWIIHPMKIASVLAQEIASTAAPLTTSLSAAWLRSAGRGEAGILWHEFFDALITRKDIQLPITKLLSVGETSGADALAGFIRLFISWGEHCSNLWEYNQT